MVLCSYPVTKFKAAVKLSHVPRTLIGSLRRSEAWPTPADGAMPRFGEAEQLFVADLVAWEGWEGWDGWEGWEGWDGWEAWEGWESRVGRAGSVLDQSI